MLTLRVLLAVLSAAALTNALPAAATADGSSSLSQVATPAAGTNFHTAVARAEDTADTENTADTEDATDTEDAADDTEEEEGTDTTGSHVGKFSFWLYIFVRNVRVDVKSFQLTISRRLAKASCLLCFKIRCATSA